MIHLHQPYKALFFHLPSLYLSYWETVFITFVEKMVARFHTSVLFPHLTNLYKFLHFYFCSILNIHDSVYKWDTMATGWLYCLNESTSWQVCVASFSSISKQVRERENRTWQEIKRFLKTTSVLMEALTHKSIILILNVSIVF